MWPRSAQNSLAGSEFDTPGIKGYGPYFLGTSVDSFVTSVHLSVCRPSFRMEHHCFHWTNFHEI